MKRANAYWVSQVLEDDMKYEMDLNSFSDGKVIKATYTKANQSFFDKKGRSMTVKCKISDSSLKGKRISDISIGGLPAIEERDTESASIELKSILNYSSAPTAPLYLSDILIIEEDSIKG